MAGIAVAGNMIVDRYLAIDAYPEVSALTTIRSVSLAPGGLVCNCAGDLARLDPSLRVPIVGVVGDDAEGQYLLERMHRYGGIDTSAVRRAGETSFTEVMEDASTGSRTFFQYRGANALLDVNHFDFDQLDADLLHVGYALLLDRLDEPDAQFGTRLARLLATARASGVATSIDAVSENSDRFGKIIPPALPHTDYLIVNEFEASRIVGRRLTSRTVNPAEISEIAGELLRLGVNRWVVVHWQEGALAVSRSGEQVVLPSVLLEEKQIATRTGAGDAFASGVLWSAWAGRSMKDALEMGLGAAALSLLVANATDGVLPHTQTLDYYRASPKVAL